MSLVGPRPLTLVELERHYGVHVPEIVEAPPGMTGLWQTLGRNNLSYRQRLRLDLFLVRHYSLALYSRILVRTVPRVWNGFGAW